MGDSSCPPARVCLLTRAGRACDRHQPPTSALAVRGGLLVRRQRIAALLCRPDRPLCWHICATSAMIELRAPTGGRDKAWRDGYSAGARVVRSGYTASGCNTQPHLTPVTQTRLTRGCSEQELLWLECAVPVPSCRGTFFAVVALVRHSPVLRLLRAASPARAHCTDLARRPARQQ